MHFHLPVRTKCCGEKSTEELLRNTLNPTTVRGLVLPVAAGIIRCIYSCCRVLGGLSGLL